MHQTKDLPLNQQKKKVNDEIHQKTKVRSDKILVLGELVYKKMRSVPVEDKQFEQLHEDLLEIDRSLAESKRDLADLLKKFEVKTCECGSELGEQDQFCGECGAKQVQEVPLSEENSKACHTCNEKIPLDALFCASCGHRNGGNG